MPSKLTPPPAPSDSTAHTYQTNDEVTLAHDATFRGVFYGYLDGDGKRPLALVSVIALGAQPAGRRIREFLVSDLRPPGQTKTKPKIDQP